MQTYIVQVGDTLYGISKQFGISIEDIKLANNLSNNNIIVGSSLVIPSTSTTILYIVKTGDSLYSIAKKYNTTVNELIRINNLKSNLLSIGQQLRIPVNDINSDYTLYVVKSGDSLYSISKNYNISIDTLKKYNNLTSEVLRVGQRLRIPNSDVDISDDDYLIYIVKSGDSLYSIAKRYNVTVDELIEINNLNSNNLSIGQMLKLPSDDSSVIPIGSSCYGEGYSEVSYITYVVKRGDNLYSIAKKYGVSFDSIKKLNDLKSNLLNIGQVLKIKESV